MSIQRRFTSEELERIKSAVHKAEEKISGEIVPVFVERSGFYTIANYRGGILLAGFTFIAIILFDRYVPSLAILDPMLIFMVVATSGIMGGIITHAVPFIKRRLISRAHLDQATRKRAETAFLEEEVFNTRQRTGILIFISFFEHEVMVLADRGISKVVDQKEWDAMVQHIIEKVRMGQITEGIEDAIHRCGEILYEKGFLKTADDINELRDDLRTDE
ncbi:MAG: TPM domain-containing protein [Cyclobacteriaceae bacterium]|nr:TPM domain-containing protein [Cyclobacteriaceae bacterium]